MLNTRTFSARAWASAGSALALLVAFCPMFTTRAQDPVPTVPTLPADGAPGVPGAMSPPSAAGMATAPVPEEPPTPAEKLIDEAIKKIAKLKTVSAGVEQEVEMLAQKLKINGRFMKGEGSRTYLLLVVSGLPDSGGRSLQVCDGETLWEYQLVLDQPYYRKLSIKPILERLNSPDLDEELRRQATTQMGLAGPETLLVGLRKNIKFDLMEEVELDGRKVWKLHGTWKNRQALVGPDSRPVSSMGVLPPYIPMDATLYLGKDDSWPYQLLLAGRPMTQLFETRRLGPDGRPIGAKGSIEKVPRSIIKLSYVDVKFNGVIKPEEFFFQAPANAIVDDNTEAIIKGLDRALEVERKRRRTRPPARKGPCSINRSTSLRPPRIQNRRIDRLASPRAAPNHVRRTLRTDFPGHSFTPDVLRVGESGREA